MSEMITNLADAELDAVAAGYVVKNSFFAIFAGQNNQNTQVSYSGYSYKTNQQNAQSNQIVVGNGSGNVVGNNS